MQIHVVEDDEWVEFDVAQELTAANGELFVYPGSTHLIADTTVGGHSLEITTQILQHTIRQNRNTSPSPTRPFP